MKIDFPSATSLLYPLVVAVMISSCGDEAKNSRTIPGGTSDQVIRKTENQTPVTPGTGIDPTTLPESKVNWDGEQLIGTSTIAIIPIE